MHQYATLEDTLYLWFGSNDTSGSGNDGASPVYDVRKGGAAADAAPTLSGSATLLAHANYPAGAYEVAVAATAANGFEAGATYGVFCTLLVDSQNPTGLVGSFTLGPVPANLKQILGTALTETAGLLAAGFKKFFNVASPTGTLNSLPDAVPGAAGGVLIAGTNAPVTITGSGNALTLTSTGGNGHGLELAGNGTGDGLRSTGGTTNGVGLNGIGGGSGEGIRGYAGPTGHGFQAIGGTTSGHGIVGAAAATSTSGDGIRGTGAGNGAGSGIYGYGGGTSGAGIKGQARANNDAGLECVKHGTGKDIDADQLDSIVEDTAVIGAAGAGLTALGDARLANLDAAISSRSTYAGGAVASVTGGVTVTTNNDKTGYSLAATGLDAVATTAPTGVASTFTEMVVQLWRRFFKKTTLTPLELKTYADNGTTVVTTQTCSDDLTTQTQGAAS